VPKGWQRERKIQTFHWQTSFFSSLLVFQHHWLLQAHPDLFQTTYLVISIELGDQKLPVTGQEQGFGCSAGLGLGIPSSGNGGAGSLRRLHFDRFVWPMESSPHLEPQVPHRVDQPNHDHRHPEDLGDVLACRYVLLADLPAHCPGKRSNGYHGHAMPDAEDK